MGKRSELKITPKLKKILNESSIISEFLPRNQCEHYINERTNTPVLLTRKDFDDLYRKRKFQDGPHMDSLGNGYGEPYIPDRQAFGILKDGRVVYCELSKAMQEKVQKYLESIEKNNPLL